jgi:hypothetical protein
LCQAQQFSGKRKIARICDQQEGRDKPNSGPLAARYLSNETQVESQILLIFVVFYKGQRRPECGVFCFLAALLYLGSKPSAPLPQMAIPYHLATQGLKTVTNVQASPKLKH